MPDINVYTPVQHLRRPPVSTGGLCWIVFAKWEDVEIWPEVNPLTGMCSTAIQLILGKTWYECQVVDKGRIFTETAKVAAAGPFWDMQVTGYLGGNNSNNTLSAGTMRYHQYVVMFKDRDGQIRFIGDEDTGADVEFNYTSGDRESIRKRSITFNWESPNPAAIYVGSLSDILDDIITPPFQGAGDFNDDFNDDFNI